jgi:hypothetical protein
MPCTRLNKCLLKRNEETDERKERRNEEIYLLNIIHKSGAEPRKGARVRQTTSLTMCNTILGNIVTSLSLPTVKKYLK